MDQCSASQKKLISCSPSYATRLMWKLTFNRKALSYLVFWTPCLLQQCHHQCPAVVNEAHAHAVTAVVQQWAVVKSDGR